MINIDKLLEDLHFFNTYNPYVKYLIVILFAYILFLITKKIILRTISKIFQKTSTTLDDILIEKKVFDKLPYLVPLVFLYILSDLLPFLKIL